MARMTMAEYLILESRLAAGRGRLANLHGKNAVLGKEGVPDHHTVADEGTKGLKTPSKGHLDKERDLHSKILEFCRFRGWIPLHGSMAHRTFRTEGEFDFVILAENGVVLFLECKTRTGKLTTEQLGLKMQAEKLGHKPHVVRSYEDFLKIIVDNGLKP